MAITTWLCRRWKLLVGVVVVVWVLLLNALVTRVPNDNAKWVRDVIMPASRRLPRTINPPSRHSHCAGVVEKKMRQFVYKLCASDSRHRNATRTCADVSCSALLLGDKRTQRLASGTTNPNNLFPSDAKLGQMAAESCDALRTVGEYVNDVLTEDEQRFPLAYSILVYRDAGQVERLLRAIYHPNNVYCLHVDRKSSDEFQNAVRALAGCFPNVAIAPRSLRIVYAGFSRLYADILCMKQLLKSTHPWRYLINLSGQAMPLKTNWEIVQILKLLNGTNNIEVLPPERALRDRFEYRWTVANTTKKQAMRRSNATKSPPPHGLTILRGSAYGAFSRSFVRYAVEDAVPTNLLAWSMDTYSPDEHFWATLHHRGYNPQLRTPGAITGRPNDDDDPVPWVASYSLWPEEQPCLGLVTAKTSPCVFGAYDLPALLVRPELFTNKFVASYQPLAQECLGRWVMARTICQNPIHTGPYVSGDS